MRAELTAALRNEQTATLFGERQDQLQERLEKGGTNLDDLVKEFGMRRGEVARFERGAGGLPLGVGSGSQSRGIQRYLADAAPGRRAIAAG